MSIPLAFLDFVLVALGIFLVTQLFTGRSKPSLPPGPKGLPLIGNVLDMPPSHEWLTFAKWGERFGDIVSVTLFGQPMIILNSAQHAIDTLDKKSSIYSDRPMIMMGGEIIGWKYTLILTPYGERFREYRRFMHRLIGGHKQVERFHVLERDQTHRFLKHVLHTPEKLSTHIRRTAGAIILQMSYGYEVQEKDDPIVDLVDIATEQFSLFTSPGAFLVDVFPMLRYVPAWFPGAGSQRLAVSWRKTIHDMADIPYEFVKNRMSTHTNIPNYTSDLLENEELKGDKEFNIKWSAASLYSAMTLFPDAQRKAQEEIDAVVGSDRLPGYADRESLPYVGALVQEVLRWNPVAPLGLHLADASVWISCAMSLAVFNVTKAIENGREIEPVVEYTSGTIRYGLCIEITRIILLTCKQ
ncbi:hypothetical protein PHLCEN_2v1439 [Hermanssonia centrifuga]|uniref:Cytochrome P450 n=1 Tax=Hermanssonia centrifuga TaxID=98765 RepID=A0A2R6S012_9APHY|nr:hypothetical protein PHLCEN_2v1439 [Hermanssonia centrifuga]